MTMFQKLLQTWSVGRMERLPSLPYLARAPFPFSLYFLSLLISFESMMDIEIILFTKASSYVPTYLRLGR